jgi:hypothetical protein
MIISADDTPMTDKILVLYESNSFTPTSRQPRSEDFAHDRASPKVESTSGRFPGVCGGGAGDGVDSFRILLVVGTDD